MYRNLRPTFAPTPGDFVDKDQLRVATAWLGPLLDLIQEDKILVQRFFQDLGRTVPPWLVPGLLEIVATEARRNDLIITLNKSCCVDPNGNGPLWS